MQTYVQFKTKIKARLFPEGEALSLVAPHDAAFQQAMLDLQKWVPCLKQFNATTFESASRYWDNAKTVVDAPYGQISRVYTVAGGTDRWRDRVFYRSSTFQEIECWSRRLYAARTPVNTGLPALPFGLKKEEADSDWAYGRARTGLWAVHRRKLYIAPWLQSSETLVVEWDGEKTSWADSDVVDETLWRNDAELAVEYYVAFRHELHYGDRAIATDFLRLYEKARADLMYWCREYTREHQASTCDGDSGGSGLYDQIKPGTGSTGGTGGGGTGGGIDDDDDDPTDDTTDEDEATFAAVGDMGEPNADSASVAAAIQAADPELFIPLGDNSYNGDYAEDFGANYQWALASGIVRPIPGNHDWDIDGTLAAYKSYFADFIGNNGNNYEFTLGPIHFLVLDTDARFADGFDINSVQAQWLQAKLFLSTARWKVVLLHRPPFSSDDTHGSDPALQLPFAAWGANAVIAGHAHSYERLSIGGIPYFVVGTGGHSLRGFTTPVDGSQSRQSVLGYLVGQADCDQLVFTFKSVAGTSLDSVTVTEEITPSGGDMVVTDTSGVVQTDTDGNVLTE